VVWRLDRLGRSLRHLIDVVTALDERGWGSGRCGSASTRRPPVAGWCFTCSGRWPSSSGRSSGTGPDQAGLASARARGRVGGRPPKLSADQVRTARRLYDERELTVAEIGSVLGVSRTSIYRALRRELASATATGGATSITSKATAVGHAGSAGDSRGERPRRSGAAAGRGRSRPGPGRDPPGDGAAHLASAGRGGRRGRCLAGRGRGGEHRAGCGGGVRGGGAPAGAGQCGAAPPGPSALTGGVGERARGGVVQPRRRARTAAAQRLGAGPGRVGERDRRGRTLSRFTPSASSASAGSAADLGKDRGCGPRRDCSRHRRP